MKLLSLTEMNSQNGDITIANIRYADDKIELKHLTKLGIKYVKRHGDTKTAFYELDYSTVDKYGYAIVGGEVPESFFRGKKLTWLNTPQYEKYLAGL